MATQPQYSVVVPTYQGQDTIRPLAQQLDEFFRDAGLSYELILVNDCGPDRSWCVMQEVQAEFGPERIKIVRLTRNFGQHNALICGFSHAQGSFVITMDEDLQHRPADIARLIAKQAEGDYDVVYGRYDALQHSTFRNITSQLLRKLLRAGIPDLHPDYTAFRLIRATTARYCLEMNNSYTFLDGYLAWITQSVSATTVVHQKRAAGQSAYSLSRLIEHSINIFVTFSYLPVRLLSFTSVVVFLITAAYSLYILVRKLVLNDLSPGFPTLIITIGFGVGLILLGMGILGEYIHRINLKTTRRPNFVERKNF
ncbi:glycosyltransferase family 2 protein [Hymenobacter sp. ISL-91]|uniref:glycosyltransferase family 2 protein n=1 Tax=Hymenobacter sp. ISL-91 TaxID=2819151 RepID=UPI001BE8716B|nr:glycosyltransferase family 2 protein [Hymenobacter sp. ISL-91]MBT2558734.1 glycosyltransferase family 2 protein [Hymenobacter sp. ISL-91]